MAEHNLRGQEGEEAAKAYLLKLGYQFIVANWRYRKAEIDLIFQKGDTLVIVEVKARKNKVISPHLSITKAKQKRLIQAVNAYIEQENIDLECRFDLLFVIGKSTQEEIVHIPDAFQALL